MERVIVLTLIAGLGWPALAAGQPQPHQPRFEVGAGGGALAAVGPGDIGALVAGGPRLSINVTDRIGFDLVADIVEPVESSGIYGLYGIHIRRVIRDAGPGRSAIFVTGGAVGLFEYDRVPERRTERLDGSIVVYRPYTEGEVSLPAAVSGGIGMQRVLARFAAFRAETQGVLGFGGVLLIRGTLGVSIPIGGAYGTK